jgi:hypothetical protein
LSVTRRSFLQLFAGAIAAAGAGVTLAPTDPLLANKRRLHARHLYHFVLADEYSERPYWAHRIDVKFGKEQWGVDIMTQGEKLDAGRELAPALAARNNAIADKDVEVGEIFTYSVDEWALDRVAQDKWARLWC